MADYKKAVLYCLKHEFDEKNPATWFTNDPVDFGGATKFGITFKLARQYGIATVAQLQSMPLEKAVEIGKQEFWVFGGLREQLLATKLFDLAFNLGLVRVVRWVQETINALAGKKVLVVDGVWGPKTELWANGYTSLDILSRPNGVCQRAVLHYFQRVQDVPSQQRFIKGWILRTVELPPMV
jgi:lysozyme family protein